MILYNLDIKNYLIIFYNKYNTLKIKSTNVTLNNTFQLFVIYYYLNLKNFQYAKKML